MPRRAHVLRMSREALLPVLVLPAALLPAPASASQCREVPFAQLIREADVIFTGRALTWDAALATTPTSSPTTGDPLAPSETTPRGMVRARK